MVMADKVHRSKANHALLEELEKAIGAKLRLLLYTGITPAYVVFNIWVHLHGLHSADISASGATETQHIPTYPIISQHIPTHPNTHESMLHDPFGQGTFGAFSAASRCTRQSRSGRGAMGSQIDRDAQTLTLI